MAIEYLDDLVVYDSLIINDTKAYNKDRIVIYGPYHPESKYRRALIKNCIIDLREVPYNEQSAAISGICGSVVIVEDTIIIGAKTAITCGAGMYKYQDRRSTWGLNNVAFIDCNNGCPEVQNGVQMFMNNCLIENWGKNFCDLSFGARSVSGAYLEAINCLFIQNHTPGLKNFFKDLYNHARLANSNKPSKLMDYITPGFKRAATSTPTGRMILTNCYFSSPSLRKDGCMNSVSLYRGKELLSNCIKTFEKEAWMMAYLKVYCPNSVLVRGDIE